MRDENAASKFVELRRLNAGRREEAEEFCSEMDDDADDGGGGVLTGELAPSGDSGGVVGILNGNAELWFFVEITDDGDI